MSEEDNLNVFDLEQDTSGYPIDIPEEDPVDSLCKALYENTFADMLIHVEVLLPQGQGFKSEKLNLMSKDPNGKHIGAFDKNPLLN